MPSITNEEAAAVYGISTSHEAMPNGERRFRLTDRCGLGYVRTEAGESGGWQNSHLHQAISETYVVQSGWIAMATFDVNGELIVELLQEGGVWTSPVGQVHNVYMSARSVTHVIKHGRGASSDWVTTAESEKLDHQTKSLREEDVLGLARR